MVFFIIIIFFIKTMQLQQMHNFTFLQMNKY